MAPVFITYYPIKKIFWIMCNIFPFVLLYY